MVGDVRVRNSVRFDTVFAVVRRAAACEEAVGSGDVMTEPHRVLIIGAGLAGLTAATALAATDGSAVDRPMDVLVVDRGRSVGGRLATRRIGDATLDHGAQFFTVRSEAFAQAVEKWQAAGVVEEWCRGFSEIDGYPRYRVVGGMNALAKHLAQHLTVITRQRASAIIPGPERWAVTYEAATREPDEADAVIATPPVPQTLELLRSGATVLPAETAERLAAMSYHRVIAALVILDRSPALPEPGALQRPDHAIFTFVADNQAKGISDAPAMTFHMSHALSAELWDHDDETVLARIRDELEATIGSASATDIQIKRWRYAGPITPDPEPTAQIASKPGPLLLAGDGFGGSKVEGAFLSGLAAAKRVMELAEA